MPPTLEDGSMQLNVRLPAALVDRMAAYSRRRGGVKITQVVRDLAEAALDREGAKDGRVSVRLAVDHHRAALLDLLAAFADDDRELSAELAAEVGRQLLEWAELRREEVAVAARLDEARAMAARLHEARR
jgi:hypothetical protein